VKLARVLAAALTTLAVGLGVQLALDSPASASDASHRCIVCWS
jgi:ABC-type hemin transport system ATPase subunit